jgi:hypothetical protein
MRDEARRIAANIAKLPGAVAKIGLILQPPAMARAPDVYECPDATHGENEYERY